MILSCHDSVAAPLRSLHFLVYLLLRISAIRVCNIFGFGFPLRGVTLKSLGQVHPDSEGFLPC